MHNVCKIYRQDVHRLAGDIVAIIDKTLPSRKIPVYRDEE
jgi:hypothetical protein